MIASALAATISARTPQQLSKIWMKSIIFWTGQDRDRPASSREDSRLDSTREGTGPARIERPATFPFVVASTLACTTSKSASPRSFRITFTESNTINNFADIDPNISGPYSLDGLPRLAIGDVTILEGNDGTKEMVFTVSLSAESGRTVDVNFAIHFPLFDRVFGTYFLPRERWPTGYGVPEVVPNGYVAQFKYPFQRDSQGS
jgi:hypothetical protein